MFFFLGGARLFIFAWGIESMSLRKSETSKVDMCTLVMCSAATQLILAPEEYRGFYNFYMSFFAGFFPITGA